MRRLLISLHIQVGVVSILYKKYKSINNVVKRCIIKYYKNVLLQVFWHTFFLGICLIQKSFSFTLYKLLNGNYFIPKFLNFYCLHKKPQ